MQALPVIVGFGGYNAAGRSSSHQAFRRIVLESLPKDEQQKNDCRPCLPDDIGVMGWRVLPRYR